MRTPSSLHPIACVLLLGLAACPTEQDTDTKPDDTAIIDTSETDDTWVPPVDADGDGLTAADGDCDDSDAGVRPGLQEICNELDENCNGLIDEGFNDVDGNGIPDCRDTEICDGLDNDGDGNVDEGFADTDADGQADCMDVEICDALDNNGDGTIDEGFDLDGDTFNVCGSSLQDPDCDDNDSSRYPGAKEVLGDGVDNNCDGFVDEEAWTVGDLVINEIMVNPADVADPAGEWIEILNTSGRSYFLNGLVITSSGGEVHTIADTYGIPLAAGEYAILAPNDEYGLNGFVDVDYEYSGIRFTNEEDSVAIWAGDLLLDRVAWDDGVTMPDTAGASLSLDPWGQNPADNEDPRFWCASAEEWTLLGDYGSPRADNPSCPTFDHDNDSYSISAGDCDDNDATISPAAIEVWYDGIDMNCDGWSDSDADFDGHDTWLMYGDDCDDTNPAINPSQVEICDPSNVDEDCSGAADDQDPNATGTIAWYPDVDADTYGDSTIEILFCDAPSGYSSENTDCDDNNAAVSPAATEICGDGIDNNCDTLATGCGVVGSLSLTNADTKLTGPSYSAQAGKSLAGGADFNADGLADFIVGAPQDTTAYQNGGGAYIVYGPVNAGSATLSSTAFASYTAFASREYTGWSVASVGDVNDDGYDDALVGAYQADRGSTDNGAAYLIYGPLTAGSQRLASSFEFSGEATTDYAGYAVAGLGDTNGDEIDDILITANQSDASVRDGGIGYVILGPSPIGGSLSTADARLLGDTLRAYAGTSASGAGDMDGDGFTDILMGAYQDDTYGVDAGAAWYFRGPVTGDVMLSAADCKLAGDYTGGYASFALAEAGDVNADGYSDILVGAYLADLGAGLADAGIAWLINGPITGAASQYLSSLATAEFQGDNANDQAGYSVGGGLDVNADGFGDFLVGAVGVAGTVPQAGAAYLILGPATGTSLLSGADAELTGDNSGDAAGSAVTGAGDVNDDGFDDILVGARQDDDPMNDSGSVYLVLGGLGL